LGENVVFRCDAKRQGKTETRPMAIARFRASIYRLLTGRLKDGIALQFPESRSGHCLYIVGSGAGGAANIIHFDEAASNTAAGLRLDPDIMFHRALAARGVFQVKFATGCGASHSRIS